ncbi:hypothetical protein TeGR_g10352 [Tetraparma gracilis]|uniref:Sugar phosphate transporter domain-containing protein n=1 Tax=Tetraparma gracilis TaxID=2962635 RepID=A0ABQ6M5C2_9STRA|nr:hypothetical protein TeGR_g10352 [Tetraparma gracilis]
MPSPSLLRLLLLGLLLLSSLLSSQAKPTLPGSTLPGSSLSTPQASPTPAQALPVRVVPSAPALPAALPRGGASPRASLTSPSSLSSLSTPLSFLLFYALNINYNIANKRCLNQLPHAASVGAAQLVVGAATYLLSLLLRLNIVPVLPPRDSRAASLLGQSALAHLAGHTLTTMSLGAGAVSFTHIVKSCEPIFSCLALYLYTGQVLPTPVYLSLLPIILGVSFACLNNLSFSVPSLLYASFSNVFFGARAVTGKLVLNESAAASSWSISGSGGYYGAITLASALLSVPVALACDGRGLHAALSALPDAALLPALRLLLLSGFYHYINNEVMFRCLANVTPVTLAVGNAFKRVFLIVSSVVVFKSEVGLNGWVGSGVACAGVAGYGVVKEKYAKLEGQKKGK